MYICCLASGRTRVTLILGFWCHKYQALQFFQSFKMTSMVDKEVWGLTTSPAPKFWIPDLNTARKLNHLNCSDTAIIKSIYKASTLFLTLRPNEVTTCLFSFTIIYFFRPQIPLNSLFIEQQDSSGKERDPVKWSTWDGSKQHYRKLTFLRTVIEQKKDVSGLALDFKTLNFRSSTLTFQLCS